MRSVQSTDVTGVDESQASTGRDTREAESGAVTRLLPARRLRRLLRLTELLLEVPACSVSTTPGPWVEDGRDAGLLAVGTEPATMRLALAAARAGTTLVVLMPAGAERTVATSWVKAIGARLLPVDVTAEELQAVAPGIATDAGMRLIDATGPGVVTLNRESAIRERGHAYVLAGPRHLLSVPAPKPIALPLLSAEPTARRSRRQRLPISTILGVEAAEIGDAALGLEQVPEPSPDGLLTVPVTPREAEAARRLLAREEGLLVSRRGALGLAASVIAVTRGDPIRRLPRTSRVILRLGDEAEALSQGPPLAADEAVTVSPMSLDALQDSLRRALLMAPDSRTPGGD